MRLSIDLDSVLADTMSLYCKLWNGEHGTKLTKADLKTWDLTTSFNVSKEESYEYFVKVWCNWWQLKPTEYRIGDKIRRLEAMGHDPWIITSQQIATRRNILAWLEENDIPHKQLCFIEGMPRKAAFPMDIYVDDYPTLMEHLPANRMHFLYTQPWNIEVKCTSSVIRVISFDDVLSLIAVIDRNE